MKVKITAPEDLSEINLGQYQEFLALKNPSNKDIIRIFLGLSNKVIGKIPTRDVIRVKSIVLDLFQKESKFTPTFTLNGKKFGFIPKLDEITLDENTDVSMYLPKQTEQGMDYSTFHNAMAVLYRPVIKEKKGQYLIEEYESSEKYANELKDMPLSVALGAMVFFYNLMSGLLKATQVYLEKEIQTGSWKNGEDTTSTILSLKETLEDLKRLVSYPSTLA